MECNITALLLVIPVSSHIQAIPSDNIMAKPKPKAPRHEEVLSAQTVGGKFARDMSEYKNHLRLVHSNQAH